MGIVSCDSPNDMNMIFYDNRLMHFSQDEL